MQSNASVPESRTSQSLEVRRTINFAGLFAPSFSLFPRLKPFYSPLSFDISSFPDIQESHIVLTTFSSPHHSTALQAPQEEQKMRPTSILAGASRIPLTGKRGNKDFYKGQSPPAFFFFSLYCFNLATVLIWVVNYRYWSVKSSRSWSPNGCSRCSRRSWKIQI